MGNFTGKGKYAVKVGNHPQTVMIFKPAIVRIGQYKGKIFEIKTPET